VRVLIATRPVDFRRGADSLAAMVQSVLGQAFRLTPTNASVAAVS